jgi:transposase
LAQAEKAEIALFFMDAAHFVLGANLGYLWCFVRCFVLSLAGRQRYNVLAALNYLSKEVVCLTNDSYINASSVCELLQLIKKSTTLPIKIILDNAKYQRCQLVITLAQTLEIELIFLPSYSPQLNLIERLWKFVKKKALYSRYFTDFEQFKKAIHEVIDNLDRHKTELNNLLMPNFQSFKNVKIVKV